MAQLHGPLVPFPQLIRTFSEVMLALSHFCKSQASPLVGSQVGELKKEQGIFLIWAWSLLRN